MIQPAPDMRGVRDLHPGVTLERVTPEDGHYFFGYYDKCPWDMSGRYLLAHKADFFDRPPRADEEVAIGVIDLKDGGFHELDRTAGWCWQQGSMLQWLPASVSGGREIIYNQYDGQRYTSVMRDVDGGGSRVFDRPIYCVGPDGRQALSVDFERLHRLRPGYGYASRPDPWEDVGAPDDAGIYWLDLQTGAHRLVLSMAWAAGCAPREDLDGADMDAAAHWFNHLTFTPDGQRFVFLHRWQSSAMKRHLTRLYTARPDGGGSRLLVDTGKVSHYTWRDPWTLLAWVAMPDGRECYALVDDRHGTCTPVGTDVLNCDGHMTYSPDGRWVLTDTYPDGEQMRTLLLYEPLTGRRVDLGRFFSPRDLPTECRCDLHPRWSRDGRRVCIDSVHEGFRGIYVLDVSAAKSERV